MTKDLSSSTPEISFPAWIPLPLHRFILWQIGPRMVTPYMRAVFSTILIFATASITFIPGYCINFRIGIFLIASSSTLIAIFLISKKCPKNTYDLSFEAFAAWLVSMQVMKILRTEGLNSGLAYMALYASMITFLNLWFRRIEQRRVDNRPALECPNA